MAFVVDASVTLSWHFVDEAGAHGQALLDRAISDGVVVPSHWRAEVANAALIGERSRRASLDETVDFIGLLAEIRTDVDSHGAEMALSAILPLARAAKLTIYDALYLELAERRGLPLASFDTALVRAARSAGLEVL